MALFRFHRGDLMDSLKTTVIVKNMDELINIIKTKHLQIYGDDMAKYGASDIEDFEIKVEPYPAELENFDKRIGWYTQIVTSDIHQKGIFQPEGFLSEPL